MADKPQFVDLISAATRQRRAAARAADMRPTLAPIAPEEPHRERSRLSHWPPPRIAQWRAEILKAWKRKR